MSLLTLFQSLLARTEQPLVIKPEHAFTAEPRQREFTSVDSRARTFTASARVWDFASTATRARTFTAPARTRDFIAGS